MYYEINVLRKQPNFARGSGFHQVHFFAIAERSLITRAQAQEAYDIFKKKFPKKDGYKISVSFHAIK